MAAILAPIRQWRHERKLRAARLERIRGFDYAAGQLLRGVPPIQLSYEADSSTTFEREPRAFNDGIVDALSAWASLGPPRKV